MLGGGVEVVTDPANARLSARLAENPDDLEARLELMRTALARQDLMAVWTHTQYLLEHWPGHPLALSYQALVRLAMGQGDVVEGMLKDAIGRAPRLLEARLHLGLVYARTGRMGQAEATMAEAIQAFPEQRAGLERELDPGAHGRVPAGSIVFVTVRAAGAEGGPPVAVQRRPPARGRSPSASPPRTR